MLICIADLWGPRWTPTSTCCSPLFTLDSRRSPARAIEERQTKRHRRGRLITLQVAQAIMGIPSDRRFLAVASKHLRHLFPKIPAQAGYSSAIGVWRRRWSG